ncbi:MAG: transcription termination/antitermination NusG family protein [Verrucomicrobiota bacterium]
MPLISVLSEEPGWFCLRSQPRRERSAQRTLMTLPGVEVILPLARFPQQSAKGAKRQVQEPIFPNYLFCRFIPCESARKVQYSQGVSYILKRGDDLVAVPERIIREIKTIAPSGVLDLAPKPLFQGEQIRLIQGIFSGTDAKVVALAPANDRVKVLLEILGSEQEISIPITAIKRNFENPFHGDKPG